MRAKFLLASCMTLCFGIANATDGLPNMELSRLAGEDQLVRHQPSEALDWESIRKGDMARRDRVLQMLKAGEIKVALDYENASLVLLHSLDIKDQRLSHAFATVALALDPTRHSARGIAKASWDRIMLLAGREQWYGTQQFQGTPPPISFPPAID